MRARTPSDRLEKLRAALNRAIEDPDVQQQMKAVDLTPAWIDPKAYEATLRNVAEDADKIREYLKK